MLCIPNTHEKLHTRVVHRRQNIRSHSVLFMVIENWLFSLPQEKQL